MRTTVVLCVVVLLAGCGLFRGSGACKEPKGYQGNAELPLLRVPEGVDPPNQRALLRIPEVKGTAKRRPDGRCLDEPPDFEARAAGTAAGAVPPAGHARAQPAAEPKPAEPKAEPKPAEPKQ